MRHQPQRRYAKEKAQSDQPPRRRGFWGRLVDEPVALFTAVLALFTIVLTVVGGIQAWAFIASERAFVSITSPDLSRIATAPDQPFEIPLVAVDSGRSTARVTAFNVTLMTSLPAKPQYVPISHFSIKPLMVNTPEILLYRAKPGPWLWKLSKPEIDKIENGDQQLFVFGYVKYRDDYSLWGDKETGFCFLYIPKPIAPNWHYETCDNEGYTYIR
jgi:hypothetical protein